MPICGTSARLSAVNAENEYSELSERVRCRIAQINASESESIAGMLCFQYLSCERGDITMTCQTMPWMRNPAGTLHGGMCAAILDQAMGFVAYSLRAGEGIAPTVHLAVDYHRPLCPGEPVTVKVHIVSVTRRFFTLTAQASQMSCPEKICLSGSGTYFFKPTNERHI